jgi:hypothetical protein
MAAFSNTQKDSIPGDKDKGCVWCGWKQSFLDGAHLIDEIQKPSVNGVWMCKNCHAVYDDLFRPLLYRALVAFNPKLEEMLPASWRKGNKISELGYDSSAGGNPGSVD